ncbi:hypothetical protein PHMEG_00025323 [Phytophthora megakarya]|uniref:Reverse transcriptase n=1 Tax=Phytophthora megakarya TaxID=4795 RepID=A0A225VBD4_9STRA|nr:hypothetical protein PHMEG_00025323 [Phytophthora megakarya]
MDTALRWSELRLSPFSYGVDPEVEARLIHDLSWPDATSTNACSIQEELPDLIFVPVRLLAQRIEDLAASDPGKPTKMLKGDVKWAFQNIPVAARFAAHFSGTCTGNEAVIG